MDVYVNKDSHAEIKMKTAARGIFFIFLTLASVFLYSRAVFSQTNGTVAPESVLEQRAKLEEELKMLEMQIDGYRNLVNEKRQEGASLERDIAIIDAQIEQAKLGIRARTLTISKLSAQIEEKSVFVDELLSKYERQKLSLAELLRQLNEFGDVSMVEMLLGYDNLSDFFVNIDSFDTLQEVIQDSFDEIRETKTITEEEIAWLDEQRTEESELREIQEFEKRRIEEREREKQKLLDATKGQERLYQQMVSAREYDAAKIRSQLFLLRGSEAIPFEKALELANRAFDKTGVRPAFLLGIIAEESNLGANVGTGNWLTDMHPTRDRPVFEDITRRLGLDPNRMPVSKKPWYGWGGAMGPAQFIPSTWVMYEAKITKLTGHNPPNPWDPEDAFIGSSLLLKENGAAAGGYNAERLAALRYFAGWKNASKPAYAFYGDEVMALAAKYQEMINVLSR